MRLVTVVRITKDGASGESALSSEVSEGYSEEQLAKRAIKQFRESKLEWTAAATAKRVADEERERLKRLQMDMFPEESPAAF